MLRVAGLALAVAFGGCYSHARGHTRCATSAGFDLAYAIGSAADIIIGAIRADHADFEAEDDATSDEADQIVAATAALAAAPPALDRAMVASALAAAKPNLARCARPAAQQIKVSVAVMPAGTVDRVIVRDHLDAATADCVTDILQTTLFPMTKQGGSFTAPFTL
jgi:hypothetical protein